MTDPIRSLRLILVADGSVPGVRQQPSPPRTVAVLVDGGCASSCEDFVLMARQSAKVTVVGPARTAGVHDYGNVRALWLPGWRRLRVPTSRSRRLPAEAIDNVGLAPDVWVPAATPDIVRFAAQAARSRR